LTHDQEFRHLPDTSEDEGVLLLGRLGLSLIPGVGAPLSEVFGFLMSRQISQRWERWYRSLSDALVEVIQRVDGLTPEALAHNDALFSTIVRASQIALGTHQREKLEALRTAVVNVALGTAPDDDLQIIFLGFVEQLSPWQLRLLAFLDGPAAWMEQHGLRLPPNPGLDGVTLVDYAFPDLAVRTSATMVYLDQLATHGLLRDDWNARAPYRVPGTPGGSRASDVGKQFLAFITSPWAEPEATQEPPANDPK